MRMSFVAISLLASILESIPSARADVLSPSNFTCAALQQCIASAGDAGVGVTAPLGYDIYYASSKSCPAKTLPEGAYVYGTQDTTLCFAGYVCNPSDENGEENH